MAVSSAIKTGRPFGGQLGASMQNCWRMRQVPKLFPYERRYDRDLR
jgi:hypothetical protein